MRKELFIKSINSLSQQIEYDKEVAKNLSKAFPNAFEANLLQDNHFVFNQLIEVLQNEFNDIDSHSWIEYFCFELDFGKKFKRGMVIFNDIDIDLKTPADLYDLLILNKSNDDNKKNKSSISQ